MAEHAPIMTRDDVRKFYTLISGVHGRLGWFSLWLFAIFVLLCFK